MTYRSTPETRAYAALWGSDRLDLDAYLARVGSSGPLADDGATLAALHRAHLAAIPFENLDVILGRGVSTELPDVAAKLVDRSRGGYCYEHATLFGAALERIGFAVDRVLARTADPAEQQRPRSHAALLVSSPTTGERWYADVGFGSGLLYPLPLAADGPHTQGGWELELVPGPSARDSAWRLRDRQANGWHTIQVFTEEPIYPVDIAVANENTSTSPGSPFTRNPIVVRKDESQVRRLVGREYSVTTASGTTETRELSDAEVTDFLREVFGDALDAGEINALLATLAPRPAEQGAP